MSEQNNKRKSDRLESETNNKKEKRPKKTEEPNEDEESEDLSDLDDLSFEDSNSENEKDDVDEEENEEEDEEEVDSDEEFLNEEINIDIVADPTDPIDFEGIKCLLHRLWLKENVNTSELANLLIEEIKISTVLRQDYDQKEDEDEVEELHADSLDQVYGVVSLIPFTARFAAKQCVIQLKNVLLSRIPSENSIHQKLQDTGSVSALVVNERFLNLPATLAVPCYTRLLTDLAEQSSDDYNFDSVIMICKLLKEKATKTKKNSAKNETLVIYQNPEDEVFSDAADAVFEYSVADQCDGDAYDWQDEDNLYEPFRKVVLLTKSKWTQVVTTLKDNI